MVKLFTSEIPETALKVSRKIAFTWIDWLIFSSYLLAILFLSLFFAIQRRKKTKDLNRTYFAGPNKVPSWVVGFSVWATILSTITYLGTPVNAYQFGWIYSFAQLTMIVVAPFILKKIIPFLRILRQNSVYSYLEVRYCRSIKLIVSSSFIFFNIFRVGIILYITTLAISFVIPINVIILMTIMGIFVIITTLLGGMKGILWSDAIQGIVRIVLILVIIIYCLININWNNYIPSIIFQASDFNIDIVRVGVPIVFLSNIIITLYSYVGSQDVVRRYKEMESPRKISSSIWFVAFLSFISIFLFYGTGSALYSFYGGIKPEEISSEIFRTNQLIPYFAFTVLPIGLGALLIASIFTASQTNISSGLTSIVNVIFSEFISNKNQKISQKKMFLFSQILMFIFGIFGTVLAIGLLYLNIDDIIVYFLGIMGLFGAAPVGLFLLAIFTKRTSALAALIALIAGLTLASGLWLISQKIFLDVILINTLWIAIFSFAITMILGYILSFIWPNKKNITNLSWPTINNDFKKYFQIEKQLFARKKLPAEEYKILEKEYIDLKKRIFFN